MRGVASDLYPSTGFRFVCYCKDRQAFARYLDRADVLDPSGGTDIFQMPPGRVKFTAGTDAMRCLRLLVLRWYADCCRTPRGWPADAVLRRSDEGSAHRATPAHAQRARCSLSGRLMSLLGQKATCAARQPYVRFIP